MKRFSPSLIASFFALHSIAFTQADLSHRKADLTVQVQSNSGTPLEGATVEVEMLNHAFRFGCAVEHHYIDETNANYDQFTVDTLQKYFNSATYGNIMKWTYYEARTEEENLAIAALPQSFKAFNGPDNLRLRGHVTIWGSSYQIPSRVKNSDDGSYISEQILQHIFDYHTTYKNSGIKNFDLYNEHFAVPELLIDKIADTNDMAAQAAEVAKWFNKAKEADPNAVLYINDYNMLNDWNGDDSRVVAYKAFVDAIRDAGGQIDGIGLQSHMDRPTTTKADVTRRLNLLSAPMAPTANYPNGLPGLRIEITELDMAVQNRFFDASWVSWKNPTMEEQVAVTKAVLEGAFEHPAVDGITIWGLDDFTHWRGNSIMYDNLEDEESGTNRTKTTAVLKDTGQVWVDKVTKEWWEDHNGSSSSNGEYLANTFKGTHRVTVTFNGEIKEQIVALSDDESVIFNFVAEAADATTYDNWVSFIDWQGEDSTRGANPDGDDRSNLEEYAFGTDPLSADIPTSPTISHQSDSSYAINYSVRAADSGLQVVIEHSTDLVNWATTPIQEINYIPTIANGLANYLVPLPNLSGNIFYRITAKEK